jgi:hypothetical protein
VRRNLRVPRKRGSGGVRTPPILEISARFAKRSFAAPARWRLVSMPGGQGTIPAGPESPCLSVRVSSVFHPWLRLPKASPWPRIKHGLNTDAGTPGSSRIDHPHARLAFRPERPSLSAIAAGWTAGKPRNCARLGGRRLDRREAPARCRRFLIRVSSVLHPWLRLPKASPWPRIKHGLNTDAGTPGSSRIDHPHARLAFRPERPSLSAKGEALE